VVEMKGIYKRFGVLIILMVIIIILSFMIDMFAFALGLLFWYCVIDWLVPIIDKNWSLGD
jgi:hypothetical protein